MGVCECMGVGVGVSLVVGVGVGVGMGVSVSYPPIISTNVPTSAPFCQFTAQNNFQKTEEKGILLQ